jgi:hypothetical protein
LDSPVVHHPAVGLLSLPRAVGFERLQYGFTRGSSERTPVSSLSDIPTRSCVRLLQQTQGKNSASLLQDCNATVARPCRSTDGLERRRCMLAGKKPEAEERLACSAWDGCRTAGEGSGARTGWASKRGSPSKPITCKIVLPFWKSESWARRGQLVATRVYSLLLLCAPLLVFYTRAR